MPDDVLLAGSYSVRTAHDVALAMGEALRHMTWNWPWGGVTAHNLALAIGMSYGT